MEQQTNEKVLMSYLRGSGDVCYLTLKYRIFSVEDYSSSKGNLKITLFNSKVSPKGGEKGTLKKINIGRNKWNVKVYYYCCVLHCWVR